MNFDGIIDRFESERKVFFFSGASFKVTESKIHGIHDNGTVSVFDFGKNEMIRVGFVSVFDTEVEALSDRFACHIVKTVAELAPVSKELGYELISEANAHYVRSLIGTIIKQSPEDVGFGDAEYALNDLVENWRDEWVPLGLEDLPAYVLATLNRFSELENEYASCDKVVKALNQIGWTADYYLDAELFNFRKIGEKPVKIPPMRPVEVGQHFRTTGYPLCYAQKAERLRPNVLASKRENAAFIEMFNGLRKDIQIGIIRDIVLMIRTYAPFTPVVRINEAGDLSEDNIEFLIMLQKEFNNHGVRLYGYTKSDATLRIRLTNVGARIILSERDFVMVNSVEEAEEKEMSLCHGMCGPCLKCVTGPYPIAIVRH